MPEEKLLEIIRLTTVLALTVPIFFVIHMLVSWTVRFLRINLMPLVVNFIAIGIGSILIVIYVFSLPGYYLWRTPLEAFACFMFVFLTLMGFAYAYFATFAISEVSLHMHIILMIYFSKSLSMDAIKKQYSKDYMLTERLQRLIELGQIEERDNRFYLSGNLLLVGSRIFDVWKMLLGFPIKLKT